MTDSSPASKTFAVSLAKYAYSPTLTSTSITSTRLRPRAARPTATCTLSLAPSPCPSPSRPRAQRVRGQRRKRAQEEANEDEDEDKDGDEVKVKSKAKGKAKVPRKYADPKVYAHLKPVQDLLQPNLDLVFCGINPGKRTAMIGHHFGHPTNKFWRSLHLAGLTDRLLTPQEDVLLPSNYNYGMTNLVNRPTAEQSELSTLEMRLSVPTLARKIARYNPLLVCFVGKKIGDTFEQVATKTAVFVDPSLPLSNQAHPSIDEVIPNNAKLAKEIEDDTLVKIEPDAVPLTPTRNQADSTAGSSRGLEWSRPLPLRLRPSSPGGRYTYFWVVPNTSGLERTPLSEQVVLFTRLRDFKDKLVKGYDPSLESHFLFRDIDLDGVDKTAEKIRLAALSKGKKV